ncbi:MAG: lactate utilization protein [Thaumarchaeota archaeon]|nr:lactate utilization protein [Nitrososphaerota archaeon]
MLNPTRVQDESSAQDLSRFLASLRDLHVEAHVVKSESETTETIRTILTKVGCKSVVVAGIPPKLRGAVSAAASGAAVSFVEDLQGRPQAEVVAILDGADVGITWAAKGVAREGAMLEVVYDDASKLASSLPLVHIALLESSSILPGLVEALPLVGKMIKDSPPERKPLITFISGPSKTGDIEMRLLYGVHGPHSVHAIILDMDLTGDT